MKRYGHEIMAEGRRVKLDFLKKKDCEKIHLSTLEILHDRGVNVESKLAKEILNDHGCWQDSEGLTHYPKKLVEDCIESTPTEFIHRGRTPEDDLLISPEQVYASNFGEGIFILDLNTRERRPTVKQDAVDIARIMDSLVNINIYNRGIGPQDVPQETSSLHNAEVGLTYTSKPKHLIVANPWQCEKVIKMAEIVAGGKQALRERPTHIFNHSPISPLTIPWEAAESAIMATEAGFASNIITMLLQGGTSSLNIASSMVMNNADFLSFNTLVQCVRKGSPTMNGSTGGAINMRTGMSLVGTPECMMLNSAMALMCNYYKIPSYNSGGWTDSKTNDVQAGVERALNRIMSALGGSSVLFGAGMLDTVMTYDLATLMVDDEIMDYVYRLIGGFRVDTESINLDLMKKVAPFGTYLVEHETLDLVNSVSDHELFDRTDYERWENLGKPNLYDKAVEKAKNTLANHKQKNPLSQEKISAIRGILVDAEEEIGVSEFWKGKEEQRFIDNMLF